MSWDALGDLAARGIEIGSHTVSHPHLPQLTDAEVRRELVDSKAEIEDELRRPCRFLAYPYGDSDGRVHAAAAKAGYAAAFALRANPWHAEQFALPRVDIYRRDGTPRFALKAAPGGGASLAALRAARGLISRRAPSR
jgi:peptidoglycan/xylan/chitin deacetylase (PgdA/CDA1 family)